MRKYSGWIGAAGLAMLLSLGTVLSAMAHEDGGEDSSRPQDSGGHWGGGMGPKGMMKEKLGLTDEQASKLKECFKKQAEETEPLREQTKIDMDTLRLKVDSKASDSEIKKILETLSADRKKMEVGRQKMQDQLAAILTPTQRAKWLLGMEGRGGERMKGMMKHHLKGMSGEGHSGAEAPKGEDM